MNPMLRVRRWHYLRYLITLTVRESSNRNRNPTGRIGH